MHVPAHFVHRREFASNRIVKMGGAVQGEVTFLRALFHVSCRTTFGCSETKCWTSCGKGRVDHLTVVGHEVMGAELQILGLNLRNFLK